MRRRRLENFAVAHAVPQNTTSVRDTADDSQEKNCIQEVLCKAMVERNSGGTQKYLAATQKDSATTSGDCEMSTFCPSGATDDWSRRSKSQLEVTDFHPRQDQKLLDQTNLRPSFWPRAFGSIMSSK